MRKILVSAYGCEPNKGSEQGVGWNWILEMARTEELWVITRANNRAGIEGALPPEVATRVHFVYYDLPPWLRRLKRGDRRLYVYYTMWQWGAYKEARRLARKTGFHYVHHLTFGSMWMPTFMHRLGIPFLWGPIGGGESVPPSFIGALPWRTRLLQHLRAIAVRYSALNPFFTGPATTARAIIARTEESRLVFREPLAAKVRVALETAMRPDELSRYMPAKAVSQSGVIEIVYTGRLVALKNVETAIRAVGIAAASVPAVRLTIIGDGPLRASLVALAHQLRLDDRIRFLGVVPQEQVIRELQRHHVFLFPSLKEGGSWSLIEAMAVGLPVICLDTTGMHVITDDTCAIRIVPVTPEQTIQAMADAIVRLATEPELSHRMGERGRRRIREQFTWERKGIFMRDLLDRLDRDAVNGKPE